ncbi:MAG: hypothetical protein ACR2MD_04980 [Aridibacter sp.]
MANKNHEKALTALLTSNSITEAATKAKLSETTLYRYLQDNEFKDKYRNARRNLLESSIGQIQGATSDAVETLKRNLDCGTPSAEIRAAQIILDNSNRAFEITEILQRLENLEANQKE